jgi:hypothetical protein
MVIVLYVVTVLVAWSEMDDNATFDDAMVTGLCVGFIVSLLMSLGLAFVENQRY